MKSSNFVIEHQCPQCGAPATLMETERLFECGFCKVRSYLCTADVFRYVLPHRAPHGKPLFYFPYWRFKGMLFSCVPFQIDKRWIDVSQQAIESTCFPHSLGFRSQALKLKFVTPDIEGRFLHVVQSLPRVLETIARRFSGRGAGSVFQQAYIGENLSLIYAPYYLEEKLYDAVLNEPARIQPEDLDVDLADVKKRKWKLDFLPTLCPACGWDMIGAPDAQVLHCLNCNTAWQSHKDRFVQVNFGTIPLDQDGPLQYLPFWRIRADTRGIQLDSYADLIKVANLPRVPQKEWSRRPFYFWCPAFKIRPQTFMPLASRLTLRQPTASILAEYPRSNTIHPVNLPVLEAVEALKINLAGIMTRKNDTFPLLNQIQIRPKSFRLVYLPFVETRIDLVQPMFNININRSQLYHAKNL